MFNLVDMPTLREDMPPRSALRRDPSAVSTKISPSCPVCKTPLRLPRIGTETFQVPCPECRQMLSIGIEDGQAVVSPISSRGPSIKQWITSRGRPSAPAWTKGFQERIATGLREPLVWTWLAAGLAAGILGIAFYRASTAPRPDGDGLDEPVVALPRDNSVSPKIIARQAPKPPAGSGTVAKELTEAGVASEPVSVPEPVLATVAPPRPVIATVPPVRAMRDWRAAAQQGLAQEVLQFEQPDAVSFETMRGEIAELIGAPIRYADGIARIEDPVSLRVSNVTVAEILRQLAGQVGLAYRVDERGVVLVRREDGASRAQANAPSIMLP